MTADEIRQYLTELNEELRLMDIKGEVSLYGGAVMCLAFKTRIATRDVDAIFEPVKEIRNAAHRIAERHQLNLDWLNMAVKMFLIEHERQVFMDLSHLRVYVPPGDYLLAMKLRSMRPDTPDSDDCEFLIKHLRLTSPDAVLNIVQRYYPHKQVPPRTVEWVLGYFGQ